MNHDRVRTFLRRFNNVEDIKIFCDKHRVFLQNRLPIRVLNAVRKKSNHHYKPKIGALIKGISY